MKEENISITFLLWLLKSADNSDLLQKILELEPDGLPLGL